MPRLSFGIAAIAASLLVLLVAGPASAAVTGTLCGEVTAFTAPTAVTDGSITIDGTAEVIDSSAAAAIDAGTITTLTTVANADATTCLEITANAGGEIVDIAIASQARVCGSAALDTASGVYSVAGVALPTALVSADADLEALLDAAIAADGDVCVDVTVDATSGAITTVRLTATLDICGTATADADSMTLGGLDVPLAELDANAAAALSAAIDAGATICASVEVVDTEIVEANLRASIELCGDVVLEADGDAVVDGVLIPAALIGAEARSVLEAAVSANADACVDLDATSTNGSTVVTLWLTATVCLDVTALTSTTVTFGDDTFVLVGRPSASIRVGDEQCVTLIDGPADPASAVLGSTGGPGGARTTGGPVLPDTATEGAAAGGRAAGLERESGLLLMAVAVGMVIALLRREDGALAER